MMRTLLQRRENANWKKIHIDLKKLKYYFSRIVLKYQILLVKHMLSII